MRSLTLTEIVFLAKARENGHDPSIPTPWADGCVEVRCEKCGIGLCPSCGLNKEPEDRKWNKPCRGD